MPLKQIRVRLKDDHSTTKVMAAKSLLAWGHLWEPVPDAEDTAVELPSGEGPAAAEQTAKTADEDTGDTAGQSADAGDDKDTTPATKGRSRAAGKKE